MAEDDPPSGAARPRPASSGRRGSGADTGWAATGTLISGMAVWGGAGWLLDSWLDARAFAPIGIILGTALAIWMIVLRYGAPDPPPGGKGTGTNPGGRRSRPGRTGQTQKGRR